MSAREMQYKAFIVNNDDGEMARPNKLSGTLHRNFSPYFAGFAKKGKTSERLSPSSLIDTVKFVSETSGW